MMSDPSNPSKIWNLFGTLFLKTIFLFINQQMRVLPFFSLFDISVWVFILKNGLGFFDGSHTIFQKGFILGFFETGFIFIVL